MRARIGLVVWIVALVAFVGPVAAQPAAQPDAQQRRDKIKQRVRAIRAYTLTEQLSLDEATAAKLFPALAKYDEEFDKLLASRADLQRRLEDAGSLKDPKAVDKVIDDAVVNQKAIWDTEARRLDQLRKILTPVQVARTLIVLPAMERRIQNQLRKVTQKPAKGRRVPGAEIDELSNPFESSTTLENPYDERKPAKTKQPAAGAARKAAEPCDPFSSVHGCRK